MDLLLPDDLLAVLRLSLDTATARANPPPNKDDELFDPKSPQLRKLVEQILFSRWFVVTYYGVFAAVIIVAAVGHWSTRWRRSHRRRRESEDASDTPSSGSSSTTLRDVDEDTFKTLASEDTPLLRHRKNTSSLRRRWTSFCTYQPKPTFALTAPANHLPANGTTLTILSLFAVNLFYLFFHTPISIPMLFAFADRAGLCFVMNLPVLYVLAAKTNQPLQYLTGWSYEGLNIFHRRLGEWMTVLAALHGAGMMGVWYTLLRPLHFSLERFLSSRVILLGIFALVAYLAIYVTSIGWMRYLCYEKFLVLHIVLQVAALVLLFFHHHDARPYVIASFAVWTFDRICMRLFWSTRKFVATLQIAPDKTTVLLFCDIQIADNKSVLRTNITQGWKPSQHVFITVPGIGWRHRLQAHPFTIASPAPCSVLPGSSWPLQLTIRAQDGFSKDLLEYAEFHQHTEILIDGPYGSTDALEASRAADRVCLVAGGSGVAVTYPLAWDLNVSQTPQSIVSSRTVYKNGKKVVSPIASIANLSNADQVTQLWVRRDGSSNAWITWYPRHEEVRHQECVSTMTTTPEDETVVDLITSRFETGDMHMRPDLYLELKNWVQSRLSGEEKLVVVVSGPDGLVRDVRNSVALLQKGGHDIAVHVEKFGW